MWTEALAILAVAFVGGLLPLFFRWSERLLHASLALATGIFLGAVFFHLLPAIAEDAQRAPRAGAVHEHAPGDVTSWLFVLVGVLGVYLIESLVLRSRDHDDLHRHRAVSFAALSGLSLHSLTTGLAYPALASGPAWSAPIFIAIISHKGLESFSLTTVFQLAEFRRGPILWIVSLFSLVTPLGIVAGALLADRLSEKGVTILSALAAGTFLYVCLGELLPEVFHHREDGVVKIALMALGIGSMLWMRGIGV